MRAHACVFVCVQQRDESDPESAPDELWYLTDKAELEGTEESKRVDTDCLKGALWNGMFTQRWSNTGMEQK